jgi:biopolymer transport protein ExbB
MIAQAGEVQAGQSAQINSILDFIIKGGVVMIPIGACSLVAIAIIVERWVSLRRTVIIPPRFVDGLKAALDKENVARTHAVEYCRATAAPLARIFATVVDHMHMPTERLEKEVEEAGRREIIGLKKNLRVLAVIANIAPLLGLLGTIFGMITAFQTVAASGEALGRTEALAKGIYEALITTAAGLIVAIPTIIAFHAFNAKIDGMVVEMDRQVVDFTRAHHSGDVSLPRTTATAHHAKNSRTEALPAEPMVPAPA